MNHYYKIVYADPPWRFSSKQLQRYDSRRFNSLESREYSTMSVQDICSLPISEITATDCALFLWVTDAHIPDALAVMKSWQFRYVTVAFVWSKKTSTGKQVATLGSWTMKNCELCLLGIKGRMLQYKRANNVYQLVEATRTRHSAKPPVVRERILSLFGNLPRIELFARERIDGWDAWGYEVISDIEIP